MEQNMPNKAPKPHKFHGVKGCARCGADHESLEWIAFVNPIVDEDSTVWSRWATCPNTGDPILAKYEDEQT